MYNSDETNISVFIIVVGGPVWHIWAWQGLSALNVCIDHTFTTNAMVMLYG